MINSRESCLLHIESYSISLHGGRCSLDNSTLDFNFENNLRYYDISTSIVFQKYLGLSKKLFKITKSVSKYLFSSLKSLHLIRSNLAVNQFNQSFG